MARCTRTTAKALRAELGVQLEVSVQRSWHKDFDHVTIDVLETPLTRSLQVQACSLRASQRLS
jgi:hypothetical protein